LDSNECKKRKLQFIVWDVIKPFEGISNELIVQLAKAKTLGFTICPFDFDKPVEDLIDSIQKEAQEKSYPIDGVVFKFNDLNLRSSLGQTSHHYKNAIAYKFYDETYPTRLRTIRWTMGRTGILTPVAIFDPIEIDGSIVEKASLHNVSIMREILGECAYDGEPLEVYKANMIIPQIASAGPKYNYGEVIGAGGVSANDCPEFCPICGHPIEYEKNDGVIIALCSNPACEGKLINRIEHFAGKKGLDIKGLSLATFGKLMDWGWINSIIDIYSLKDHRDEWVQKPHFGPASVDKVLQSIEDTKTTTLNKFIAALGIPLIGNTAANKLVKVFSTYEAFREAVDNSKYHFYDIESFGPEMDESLKEFNYEEADAIYKLLTIPKVEQEENEKKINLNVVITGKLKMFKNRAEFVSAVEKAGGKVASSVSSKTDILVNNDINSQSSKNVTAKKLGIPIMTEEEFFEKYFDTKK
jgi:DNA ligase (NAD+)